MAFGDHALDEAAGRYGHTESVRHVDQLLDDDARHERERPAGKLQRSKPPSGVHLIAP
jgi:hypothetical protein